MTRIEHVHAREVFDSRGRPTVEVEMAVEGDIAGRAVVPSGASTGRHEALEIRDGDPDRLHGLGVRRVVRNVNEIIAPRLRGMDVLDQKAVDDVLLEMDGTPDKSRLGANALLGVSLAAAHAAAASLRLPLWRHLGGTEARVLPLPMINMISGGLHASRSLDFQDFLIVPVGAETFSQALEMSLTVHHNLQELLAERGLSILRADEGGFGPVLESNRAALDLLMHAVERARLRPGEDVAFAIDVAASHFFENESRCYRLSREDRVCQATELIDLLAGWMREYPIVSIEDPLAEDEWDDWRELTRRLGDDVQILGDDLFTTNLDRLRRGVSEGVANAVLIKMNQIGTLSETLAVIRLAQSAGYRPVVSARSGETEDVTMADLAVGTNAGQIKIGSLTQSERLAKYNQLLRIEEALGSEGVFQGWAAIRSNREVRGPDHLRS